MEENISDRSGFVRLALGTGLTALGISHLAKDSGNRSMGALFVAAGAMKVAEGIFLYCPTKALINSNVKDAVSSSFSEYLDGDSILQAYNESYSSRWGDDTSTTSNSTTSKNNHSSSNSGNSNSSAGSKGNSSSAAADIAKIVSSASSDGSMSALASQATKAATTVLNDQNKQKH